MIDGAFADSLQWKLVLYSGDVVGSSSCTVLLRYLAIDATECNSFQSPSHPVFQDLCNVSGKCAYD
jgi:hypothetical protein